MSVTVAKEPQDAGAPIILFDSHPEEQYQSYIGSAYSFLTSQLHMAFTGIVPRPHTPGNIRVIWYTVDGNEGMKDYQLHEYAQVRDSFDELLKMDEIRRVVVMGYPTENPFGLEAGGKKNPIAKAMDKKNKSLKENREEVRKNMARDRELYGDEGGGMGVMDSEDEEEEIRELEEKKEGDGLLSSAVF